MSITAGYDVGGAHLKVARLEDGRITAVRQIACPLWKGLDQLSSALDRALEISREAGRHAVTMTGELTEIFPSREVGTRTLISFLSEKLGPEVAFYVGLKGFATAQAALADLASVASANFLATAAAISRTRPNALLIDMGSTTTDIIPCSRPQGSSDAERLQTGELVYTGFTRTPVPSVVTRAPLLGTWQTLARDAFANMADVRRILGELPEDADLHETVDGRGKSLEDSLARFARGFGRDGEMRHLPTWQRAAAYVCEAQLRSIYDGAIQVLSRPGLDVSGGVVAAGIGTSVSHAIAQRLSLNAAAFGTLIPCTDNVRDEVTRHATAAAVALLRAG